MGDDLRQCPGCFLEAWAGGPCPRCGYRLDPGAYPTALPPGTVVSKYTVGRVLGKPGGFGITYLAFDPVLNRRLALKELMPRELVARHPDRETLHVQTRDDEALFRYTLTSFLNEARLVAQFGHPNLVRVLDYFESNGTAYFAMEYYEGRTLAEHVQASGGRLSGDEAVALILPLLDALDYIHTQDEPVLHRDIKPANIYITGRGTPILLDFGAARVALGQQSRSLSAVLTPGFAPFEQYSTRGIQGPWTDVYGCAATLYFLVTGQAPPEASIRLEDPRVEPPGRFAPELSPVVAEAIVRGLGFRPEERPRSAAEFRDLLTGQAQAGESATEVFVGGVGATDRPPLRGAAPAGAAWDRPTDQAPVGSGERPTVVAPLSGAGGYGSTTPPPGADATRLASAGASFAGGAGGAASPVGAVGSASPSGSAAGAGSSSGGGSRTKPALLAAAAVLVLASGAWGITRMGGDSAGGDPLVADAAAAVEAAAEEAGEAAGDPPVPDRTTLASQDTGGASAQAPPEAPPATEGGAATAATGGAAGQGSAPATSGAASTGTQTAAAPATGVLVIVYGDDSGGANQVESALLRSLLGRSGLQALDASALSMIRGDQQAVEAANAGNFSSLAALGRQHGAEFLVVGDLTTRAQPSVGQFFAGTAEMDMKMYRVSSGDLVDANTFRIEPGETELALSEGEARSRAAQAAGSEAAQAAQAWLARAMR